MKLREVKWHNHPILGDLKIDLVNSDTDIPYDTIVIAGENGTGKTTILKTLYDFLNQGPITPFEYVEYQLDNGDIYQAYPLGGNALDSFFKVKNMQTQKEFEIRSNRNNNSNNIRTTLEDPRHYGCAYTKARANYETQAISTISGMTTDADIYNETAETNANRLKQLLVDVQNQDNREFTKLAKETGIAYPEFEPNSKMHRFSSAFNNFFDNNLKYDRVETIDGKHEVFFQKHGADIKIDNLSTGESQIVFRGAYLLRNAGKLDGSIIFIDEPEISMHPLWQEKILSYYKGIFTKDGVQKAQLIVATHSQGVIRDAIKDKENTKIIVLTSDANGKIGYSDNFAPAVLNYISEAEINYQAFNIYSPEYHDALYGYIESEGWFGDFCNGKKLIKYIKLEIERNGKIKKDADGNPITREEEAILSKKVRNLIHHPENTYNGIYSNEELKQSIKDMRKFIATKRGIKI